MEIADEVILATKIGKQKMLVMIRWLMTITLETMISTWPMGAGKFSLDLDRKGRSVRHYARRGENRGMSQMDLFMESGIDRTYISAVERGIQSPTIRMIVRFAKCLRIRPSESYAGWSSPDFIDPRSKADHDSSTIYP